MPRINILIVEDQQGHIDQWQDAIDDFNIEAKRNSQDLEFYCQFAKSYGAAKKCINSFNFSAAIVDIRLAEDDGQANEENTKGNEVLLEIVRSTMCLAWIYTGQQTDADIPEPLVDYIELIDRAAKSKSEVLEDLAAKQDMLDSMAEIKNQFSQSKAKHFYSAIWPRWSLWSTDETDYKDKAIIRHMATHLHASFLNETQKVHPEEYYFTGPMIHDKLDTGDITLVDNQHFILVTPRCEIAQTKNINYQFVELEDKSNLMEQMVTELAPLLEDCDQKKAAVKEHKKSLAAFQQQQKKAIKAKNVQVTTIRQAIANKAKTKEEEQLTELNSKIATDTVRMLELESNVVTAVNDVSSKERELSQAEIDLKKSTIKYQKHKSAIDALLPSAGGKISLHILPEVKQPSSVTYGPLHAQFEKITYIAKDNQAEVARFKQGKYARLSNEFIPSFVERLGSHFSRIGTPDYSHPG